MAVLINTTKSEIKALIRYARIGANNCRVGSWEMEEVVRCKDCKRHEGDYFCTNFDVVGFEGNDYCSLGERREDG